MSKSFYPKLALSGIKKNGKTYTPFIITSIITVAMYYVVNSLSSNPNLGVNAAIILGFGEYVVAIFSIIFLFYTNSFLMKQRKKEFGLFNILGMEKKHITRLVAFETFFMLIVSLIIGLALGIVLDKLMYLIILKILNMQVKIGFYISAHSIINTLTLFAVIYLFIFLNGVRSVYFTKTIDLLKSKSTGEKEPKAKWILAILGIGCIGAGYYLSLSTTNFMQAINTLFFAVVLVIVGTYLLFIAGTIAFLKLLRKNKRYYYKSKHFISVSGMLYRMKQNAVGLANICILSTMVLVMVSSTLSLKMGMNTVLSNTYPFDLTINTQSNYSNYDEYSDEIEALIEKHSFEIAKKTTYDYIVESTVQEEDNFRSISDKEHPQYSAGMNITTIKFISVSQYNSLMDKNVTLRDDEVLVFAINHSFGFNYDNLTISGKEFKIKDKVKEFPYAKKDSSIFNEYFIFVNDIDYIEDYLYEVRGLDKNEDISLVEKIVGYDFVNKPSADEHDLCDNAVALVNEFYDIHNDSVGMWFDFRCVGKLEINEMYGSFLFLGIFLGTLFIMAMILIIYYKQISEGYDDKQRFEILKKVGMSQFEIKKTINSQILTVFFMPLILAGLHIIFAYPLLSMVLTALMLPSTTIYIVCNICTYIVFALIYALIYKLTAKTYYKIVM